MASWIRFEHGGKTGFGTLEGDTITVHEGNMFDRPRATAQKLALSAVKVLTPTEPSKMIALSNNFNQLAQKMNQPIPKEPLYFVKTSNSFLPTGQVIRAPKSFDGKVVFEGELGIVIGKQASAVSEDEAPDYIFGYTCINDVTAAEILGRDPSFAQWTRAKNFDTFGVFGPVITTGLDPAKLSVKAVLNGQERQNYPLSDIVFTPAQLVSHISRDMTLYPGDVICCGTSVGVGSMKPGSTIEVTIEGIGTLTNRYE